MTDCGIKIGAFPNENGGSKYSRSVLIRKMLKGRENMGLIHLYIPSTQNGLMPIKNPVTV